MIIKRGLFEIKRSEDDDVIDPLSEKEMGGDVRMLDEMHLAQRQERVT